MKTDVERQWTSARKALIKKDKTSKKDLRTEEEIIASQLPAEPRKAKEKNPKRILQQKYQDRLNKGAVVGTLLFDAVELKLQLATLPSPGLQKTASLKDPSSATICGALEPKQQNQDLPPEELCKSSARSSVFAPQQQSMESSFYMDDRKSFAVGVAPGITQDLTAEFHLPGVNKSAAELARLRWMLLRQLVRSGEAVRRLAGDQRRLQCPMSSSSILVMSPSLRIARGAGEIMNVLAGSDHVISRPIPYAMPTPPKALAELQPLHGGNVRYKLSSEGQSGVKR